MGNLAIYATKGFEYLLILGFLAVFTLFYLYLTSRRFEQATEAVGRAVDRLVDWFRVPDGLFFHQGHTWTKRQEDDAGLAEVGMDDFARKMAGPMRLGNLPAVGATIKQGERGWSLHQGGKQVDMLAPLSGVVVAINRQLPLGHENWLGKSIDPANDPYDGGWILKIRPDNFERERKNLLHGELARKWMEGVVNLLRQRMSADLGAVLQDGGEPMPGMAKNIDHEQWDRLLQEFFLTD